MAGDLACNPIVRAIFSAVVPMVDKVRSLRAAADVMTRVTAIKVSRWYVGPGTPPCSPAVDKRMGRTTPGLKQMTDDGENSLADLAGCFES